MIKTITDNLCTGCSAFQQACKRKAITMIEDCEGFLVPSISDDCVECGICLSICPQNKGICKNSVVRSFGMRLKDGSLLSKSASGGVFAGLAKVHLAKGGYVFGCAFDENMVAKHICIDDLEKLEALQGSKYVQSNNDNTYLKAKELLGKNYKVLYSGTPCQIQGLYASLGHEYENLFTIDLICHGVPSPLLFGRWMDHLAKRMNDRIVNFNFRCKDNDGWGMKSCLKTSKKSKQLMPIHDQYLNSFLKRRTYRECCYQCKYSCRHRPGDLTIGDFWGVSSICPDFWDIRGVSAVLVNNEKGLRMFEEIAHYFETIETTFDSVAKYNGTLRECTMRPDARDHIYKEIYNKNVDIFKLPIFKVKITPKLLMKSLLPLRKLKKLRNTLHLIRHTIILNSRISFIP